MYRIDLLFMYKTKFHVQNCLFISCTELNFKYRTVISCTEIYFMYRTVISCIELNVSSVELTCYFMYGTKFHVQNCLVI